MLGAKSKYSNECYEGQFIGAGFLPNIEFYRYKVNFDLFKT